MALDPATSTLKNKVIFEGYKQNRSKEAKKEVYKYINSIIKGLSSKLDLVVFSFIKEKSYEADQIIAFIVKKYCGSHEIIIYSGDKDLLQVFGRNASTSLLNNKCAVFHTHSGSNFSKTLNSLRIIVLAIWNSCPIRLYLMLGGCCWAVPLSPGGLYLRVPRRTGGAR